MTNRSGKYIFIAAVAAAAVFAACTEEGTDNTPHDPLKVSRTEITVGNESERTSVSIASTGGWTLSGYTDWCSVEPAEGEAGLSVMTVDISEYRIDDTGEDDPLPRETVLTITSNGIDREIRVKQLAHKITTPNQHEDYFINEEVYRDILSHWYLWNGEVAATRADYNQPYDQFVRNYLLSLKKNIDFDGGTWSRNNERYVYSYAERRTKSTAQLPRLNYGMEFDFKTLKSGSGEKIVGRVLYVMPGSPADAAGLKRGDWFHRVNGRTIEEWNYTRRIDTLVRPLPSETVTLGMVKRNYAGYMEETGTSVALTPSRFRGNPILHSSVIQHKNIDGGDVKTGYLVYNSFDPFYRQELIKAFEGFRDDGIDSFILDLRYNGSGSVEMAELAANLIAPRAAADNNRTLVTYTFNNGSTRDVKFEPHESGIGIEKLVVIATQFTAGASELLINAFNELEEIGFVMVGGRTEGMSVGMAALEDIIESNEYVYNIYPVAFGCSNDKGTGNYRYGFSPNGLQISEWDDDNIVWDTKFGVYAGKSSDELLVKALQYAAGNIPLPGKPAAVQTSSAKEGYPRLFSTPMSMTMKRENITVN